jgi:hypothetical protein
MLKALPFLVLGGFMLMGGCRVEGETLSDVKANQIADAIFKLENSKKYPYGIKSVKTSNPRKICLNTINNNWARWQSSKSKEDFLTFLASKYCPQKCDPIGHKNWVKNIHALVK